MKSVMYRLGSGGKYHASFHYAGVSGLGDATPYVYAEEKPIATYEILVTATMPEPKQSIEKALRNAKIRYEKVELSTEQNKNGFIKLAIQLPLAWECNVPQATKEHFARGYAAKMFVPVLACQCSAC